MAGDVKSRRFSYISSSASNLAVTLIDSSCKDYYFNEQEETIATRVFLDFLHSIQEFAASNVSAPAAALNPNL